MNVSTNRLIEGGRTVPPSSTQPLDGLVQPPSAGTIRPQGRNTNASQAQTGPTQPPADAEAESINLGSTLELSSDATSKFGSALKVDGLDTLSGALATPGAILHLMRTGGQLIQNPDHLVRQAGQILENPVESAQNAWDAVNETKDAAETVLGAAELGRDAVASAASSIRDKGLRAGVGEAGRNLKALAQKNYTEFRENISSTTGQGFTHAAKELAAQTESRTTRRVAAALSEHLYTNPELAPQGVLARARRAVGNVFNAASDRVMGVAHRVADRSADFLARNPIGQSVLNGLDYLNPAHHVSETVLAAAAREGTTKGVAAGTEAVVNSLKKAGHEVITDASSGSITRIVAKSGQEIAVEGLQAATQAGVQAAVRETAQAGVAAGARGLVRFAPGVNVALAAYDVYHAGQVWSDPKASGWQKGMATVTAIGSIAAATNIPIVSQVGAGISLASSVLENIPPTILADAGKAVARGTVRAGRAVARGVTQAGQAAAEGVANAGRAVLASAGNTVNALGGSLKKIGGFFGFGG